MHFNSLYVPLDLGSWQCFLVPARDYRSPSGEWLRFMRGDELNQLADDRRAFDLYFRPRYDFRSRIRTHIDAICSFIRDHLNVAHWNMPTDNAGIERILKQAVRDSRLVPVVNRNLWAQPSTFRPAAVPLNWPSSGGVLARGGTKWAAFADAGPGPLTWDGEPVLSGPYDPATVGAKLKAARAALRVPSNDEDSGLPGIATAVARAIGTATGATFGESYAARDEPIAGRATLLDDAQPFEYGASEPSGDAMELAGIPFDGVPNTWVENAPGKKKQWRMYGSDGTPAVDIDFDNHHGQPNPHAHNWDDQGRDHGWPVSILP